MATLPRSQTVHPSTFATLAPQKGVDQTSLDPTGNRSSSLGSWVRSSLRKIPRERSERGGTIRDQGFWEEMDNEDTPSGKRPRRLVTDSCHDKDSETADSDRLTRWNTPKDLPETRVTPSHRRAVSAGVTFAVPADGDRKFSFVPRVSEEEHFSVQAADSWHDLRSSSDADVDTEIESAKVAADRRLSNARRTIEAKKESRKQRRSLKESGDYLGVQGINPETGRLDVVTPSDSENSAISLEYQERLRSLRQKLKDARSFYESTLSKNRRDVKKILSERDKQKIKRLESREKTLGKLKQASRWRRQTKQWSSVQEPELSPIAQSQRSSVAVNHLPVETLDEAISDYELINLSSSNNVCRAVPKLTINPVIYEALEDTTSSGGTVVKTPHAPTVLESTHKSMPAALELFENGISFDDFRTFSADRGKEPAEDPFSLWETMAPQQHAKAAEKQRNIETQYDPIEVRSTADHVERESFLCQTSPRDVPSLTGKATEEYPLCAPTSLNRPQPIKLRRTFSLVHRRETRPLLATQTEHSFKVFPRNPGEKEQSLKSLPCPEDTLLHRANPAQLLHSWWKRSEGRNSSGKKEAAKADTRPKREIKLSAQNVVLGSRNSSLGAHTSRGRQATSKNTFVSEVYPQSPKDETKDTGQKRLNFDPLWAEDAMRDISSKENQVVDEYASIPITTTIGSGPKMSGSSLLTSEAENQGAKSFEFLEKESRCKVSHQKMSPSALPRLNSVGQDTPSVTTATSSATHTGMQTKKVLASPSPSLRRKEKTEAVYSTSPTSTSGRSTREASKDVKARLTKSLRRLKKEGSILHQFHSRNHSVLTLAEMGLSSRDPLDRHGRPLRRYRKTGEVTALVRDYPGMYPFHLDAAVDIAGLSKRPQVSSTRWLEEGCSGCDFLNTMRYLVTTSIHVMCTMARLYWAGAGPVFDASSACWERRARNEATLMDYVSFVLAVPGAIASIMVFLWFLKFSAQCWKHSGIVLEVASDEILFWLGN